MLNNDLTVNSVNDAFLLTYKMTRRNNFNVPISKFANGNFNKPGFEEIVKEIKEGSGKIVNREIHYELSKNDKRI
jgi:hypothetical protein